MLSIRRALIVSAFATLAATVSQGPAQQAQPPAASQNATPPPPADATPKSLSSSLGVYVFPGKGHAPGLQSKDEGSCFSWAKGQTGIDPAAPPPPTQAATATQQTAPDPSKGSGAKGAAGGAAAETAIGATAGAVKGRAAGRKAKKQEQPQQQQAQAPAQADDRKTTYNKAFSACMEGKG
jgi:hypothetical protein